MYDLETQIREVVLANDLRDARVRITLGEDVLITAVNLTSRTGPATVTTAPDSPINERSPLVGLKCTSYAENTFLLRQHGTDEVLRANTRGELCEGCYSNVFFVLDHKIHTPALESGCLPGVMRSQVMNRMDVTEGRWPLDILQDAEEIWLSNAIRKLRFVSKIDNRELGEPTAFFQNAHSLIP